MAALANDLGEHGIWVDQLTTLDPHPLPFDAPVTVANNIVFADNYYQDSGNGTTIPDGAPVDGAINNGVSTASNASPLNLGNNIPGLYDAYGPLDGGTHADVHLFYQGTIPNSPSDGSYTAPPMWYSNNGVDPTTTGFDYSLMENGKRPFAGLSNLFGGDGTRSVVTVGGDQWADIGYINLSPASAFQGIQIGSPLYANYSFETPDSNAAVNWYISPIANYSVPASTDIKVGSSVAPTTNGQVATANSTLDTSNAIAGQQYFIYATITDDGHTRTAYIPGTFSFVAAPYTPPVASLSFPANGTAVSQNTINSSPRYIDVTFSDTGGSGLNLATITGAGEEFSFGGSAAGGVSVIGAPLLVSGTTYRYTLSGGGFGLGNVTVNFIAGSWADNAGNLSAAFSQSFTVTTNPTQPVITAVTPSTLLPLPGTQTQLITLSGTGFNSSSTLTFVSLSNNYTYSGRVPTYNSATGQLQYNISVGRTQQQWQVYVVDGGVSSAPATFWVTSASPVSTPTISPNGGSYQGSEGVSLSTATSGATIYYTLDGSDPTSNSPFYTGSFTLTASALVKAKAFKAGLPDSAIASADFTITAVPTQVATPEISPNGGTFNPSVQVSITEDTPGAAIIYTTNGNDPTLGGTTYTGPFTLTQSSTVRAYAIKSGLQASAVNNAGFQVYNANTPLLSVDQTDYNVGPNSGEIWVHLRNGGGGTMSYDAYSWSADSSWLYSSANGTSTGPQDEQSFWFNFDLNTTGTTRVGHITIWSGETTQGAPLTITVTQTAVPDVDLAAADVFLTDSQYGTTRITAPQVGQQLYIRYTKALTGGTPELIGFTYPFADHSPTFTIAVDGTPLKSAEDGGNVPSTSISPSPGIPWTVTPGTHTIELSLDVDNTLPETNESNNHVSLTFTAVQPAFSVGDVSLLEGDSGINDAIFTVSLSAASFQSTTVDYATSDGTAQPGSDYQAVSGTLAFAAGEMTKTIAVPVNGDTNTEPDESFALTLSNPTGAIIADAVGIGTILNDDLPNPPPNTPTNVSPADGATGIPLTATLQGSAFADPNAGASQTASQWVVTRASDSIVVFNSGEDPADKTNISIGSLAYGTAYTWKVRYENNDGIWSNYSNATAFTTVEPAWLSASAGAAYTFSGPIGNQTLTLSSGTTTFTANASSTLPNLVVLVGSGASVIFNTSQNLSALDLSGTASAAFAAGAGKRLFSGALSLGSASRLDLADSMIIVSYIGTTPDAAIRSYIQNGYNNGHWTGAGITSSTAASDSTHTTGVGYYDSGTQIKIGRTWYGDANVDGAVNADDFALMMLGKATGGTGWQDGNFNYDAKVNADDWMQMILGAAYSKEHALSSSSLTSDRIVQQSVVLIAPLRGSLVNNFSTEVFGQVPINKKKNMIDQVDPPRPILQ